MKFVIKVGFYFYVFLFIFFLFILFFCFICSQVENYTFYDGTAISGLCKSNEVGEYLEVAIAVKSQKAKEDGKEAKSDEVKDKGHFQFFSCNVVFHFSFPLIRLLFLCLII